MVLARDVTAFELNCAIRFRLRNPPFVNVEDEKRSFFLFSSRILEFLHFFFVRFDFSQFFISNKTYCSRGSENSSICFSNKIEIRERRNISFERGDRFLFECVRIDFGEALIRLRTLLSIVVFELKRARHVPLLRATAVRNNSRFFSR